VKFKYDTSSLKKLTLKNDGGSIFFDLAEANSDGALGGIETPNGFHNLESVRFRGKGEHTLRGKRAALEVQMVHVNKDTMNKVIVAALLDGPAPALLQTQTQADPLLD